MKTMQLMNIHILITYALIATYNSQPAAVELSQDGDVNKQDAVITDPPNGRVAMSGGNTSLACRVVGDLGDGQVFQWIEYRDSQPDRIIYADTTEGPLPFDEQKYHIFGKYDLSIKSLTWEDGATYQCRLLQDETVGQYYGAHLFVFLGAPTLTLPAMEEDDQTYLGCEVRFGAGSSYISLGNIPQMTISVGSEVYPVSPKLSTVNNDTAEPYTLSGNASYTARAEDHNSTVTCNVSLAFPEFLIQNSEQLNVKFSPRDIVFTPEQETYGFDQSITCSALANEEAEYQWTALESPLGPGTVVNGAELRITEAMHEAEADVTQNRWECSATNDVGQNAMTKTFTIDPSYSSGYATWPTVSLLPCLCTIVMLHIHF